MPPHCVAAVVLLLAAQVVQPPAPLGPGSPAAVPFEHRGLAVGERIPALDLVDQNGRRRALADLTGPNGLVLLFVRSADW
jgi:hypothetical protein